MRKRIIAGNWKMNKTVDEAIGLAQDIKSRLTGDIDAEVVLCPPFTDLSGVQSVIKDSMIKLGAQNVFWEQKGAFTGEIAADMLVSSGCEYVIIGHSERRQYFGESDETVSKRMKTALAAGLKPILCVGEQLKEREQGTTEKVLETQVCKALNGLSESDMANIVIAYEPVWAIGTGKVASPQQAQEAHAYIRKLVQGLYHQQVASNLRIQYGGSMKPDNAAELLSQSDVDGGLIGGASLDAESFLGIIQA